MNVAKSLMSKLGTRTLYPLEKELLAISSKGPITTTCMVRKEVTWTKYKKSDDGKKKPQFPSASPTHRGPMTNASPNKTSAATPPAGRVPAASVPEGDYIPLSDITDSVVQLVRRYGRGLSQDEWESIAEMHRPHPQLYRHWPTRLLHRLVTETKDEPDPDLPEVARSLLDYSREHTEWGVTVSMLGSAMKIYTFLSDPQEALYEVYKELQGRTTVFDADTALNVIQGLAITEKWKTCYDIVRDVELTGGNPYRQWAYISMAAFRNGEIEEGWRILEYIAAHDEQPIDAAFLTILDLSLNQRNLGYDLLDYMRQKTWVPTQRVATKITSWFLSEPGNTWKSSPAIVKHGKCSHCGQQLEAPPVVSDENFHEMKEAFFDSVLKQNDLFLNTNPEELTQFRHFLEGVGKFDVIVDGLNIALKGKKKTATANSLGVKKLRYALECLRAKRAKVLVLGRQHMARWPRMDTIRHLATWFYLEDVSQDDPYMLYAALHSGVNTFFLTADELRDHSFKLGPRLCKLFRHWQMSHQIVPVFDPIRQGITLEWPDKHQTIIQQGLGGWHIPYEDGASRPTFQAPNNWMCLQKT